MNPHRYTWTLTHFPVASYIAGATLMGLLFSKEKKWPLFKSPIIILLSLWGYYIITTTQAFNPSDSWPEFERVSKMILMALVTLSLCLTRSKFEILSYVVALSLGLLGFKGGIFSLMTGGTNRVWGPEETFIEDNNCFALALNMIIPFLYYLGSTTTNRTVKYGFWVMFFFNIIAVIFTYSRGGFLGLVAVLLSLGLRSKHKFKAVLGLGIIAAAMNLLVTQQYKDRISTISTYSEDASTLGRFNAWGFAFNLAQDRPLIGGGFQIFSSEDIFRKYAPDPENMHDAHSIYFEVLGEHGFLALGLFLSLFAATFYSLHKTRSLVEKLPTYTWAVNYSNMLEVGLIAYLVSGMTLGLANFDLLYHFIISTVALRTIVWEDLRDKILTLGYGQMSDVTGIPQPMVAR